VGVCGPGEFHPTHPPGPVFLDLRSGLEWCDAVMALRLQRERHDTSFMGIARYSEDWQLNPSSLKYLSPNGFILHPGPINFGVEMSAETLNDKRNLIYQQVENGVRIRAALVQMVVQ
ncbi:MAG: aspartate carbamoyltransferase catalytic subunit, partial [Bdellovibrionaceae bacterium]|nr:aspartate carbamoyltransferase catalytic subunit [Pseudobdellovibrionaceae bacterium]